MDDLYIYLLAGAGVVVVIIIVNSLIQKNQRTSILKAGGNTAPVLLQQAVEKKLKTLKTTLYNNNATAQTDGASLNGLSSASNKNQKMIEHLHMLEKDYADGKVNLKTYDHQLRQVILKMQERTS